ncbi:hypothetical protein [Methanobrevibacter oralis]|uniref:Uncharacterized protein n=1 Tax=Methanobrevibacter oralis TaxID=66851 RepID=A0A162FH96_METOA|nr:hypothetical protein [Methanobrevibacter oralis]KZX09930.1 hypothetical protein MBORA_19920 [Methanobrevibacter oralis]
MRSGDKIQIEQKYVQIREGQNKIMALSYKAPLFETVELERFFDGLNASEKIQLDIGGTGDFGVSFRGLIEGKEKNFSRNIDHKILLLEEYKCPKKGEYVNIKRYSKFVPKNQQQT